MKNNGQYTDASRTLEELNLALDALIRMDKCEDLEPWNASERFDGFFIRNDVPPVLSKGMTDYLNDGLLTGSYSDYVNAYLDKPGMPFSINSNVVLCHRKFTNSNNYYYNYFYNSFDPVFDFQDYTSQGETYETYWKSDKFTSNDEIIGLYMGLALVGKYVDDETVLQKARDIATNMKNFAILNICGAALNRIFIMHYPDCERITDENGGNSVGYIYGLLGAWAKINDSNMSLASLFNSLNLPYTITMGAYASGVATYTNFDDPIDITIQLPTDLDIPLSFHLASYNRPLYSILVAISDRTGNFVKAYEALKSMGNEHQYDTFYMLLWAAINDKDLRMSKYGFRKEILLEQLLSAPCEGPYHYNFPNNQFPAGWACEYKFGASLEGQNGASDRTGVFSGADYMLLYNLACLAFPNGFEYNGETYKFPLYSNQINRSANNLSYPFFVLQHHFNIGQNPPTIIDILFGNSLPDIEITYESALQGTIADPEIIKAITSITSNMVVKNHYDFPSNMPPSIPVPPNLPGDVSLIAGENILLTDGFRVDAGAHFLARIESYSCDGKSYKNMQAPPWESSYSTCFFDTISSNPQRGRTPIYTDNDDYSKYNDEFDTPLWDDYYYPNDTTASPELAVGVWLNPNPCRNSSMLSLVSENDTYITIELFDMGGQKRATLFEGQSGTSSFELNIDMSLFAKGMYVVRIIGNGGTKVLKLVKE